MAGLLLSLLAAAALLSTKAEAFTPFCSDQSRTTATALNAATGHSTVVIGGGRIGSILAADATLLGRTDSIQTSIDPNGTGPIYIATRNDGKCPQLCVSVFHALTRKFSPSNEFSP